MENKNVCPVEISVIIPCYNSAKTVVEALASMESDTFSGFEVLVINDGSQDDTKAVVEAYAKKSTMHIRLICQKNAGVSMARNNGIDQAVGKYLIFLDADDALAPNYLEAVSSIMGQHPCDVMVSKLSNDSESVMPINLQDLSLRDISATALMEEYTYLKKETAFSCFVYQKRILDEYDLRFTPEAKHGEDIEFVTKFLAHCASGVKLDAYCYYYRLHPESAIRRMSYRQTDILPCVERTAMYLDKLQHPFAGRFREYMYHKALFSVAHRFARGRSKDLYNRLIREYPVRDAMRFICRDGQSGMGERLAAYAYLVHPWLYYLLVFV